MARRNFFSSLFFIILSLYVCWESLNLGFGKFAAPGPGFLSFLLGLTLGFLALLTCLGALLKKEKPEQGSGGAIPWAALLAAFGALIGFTFLLRPMGFNMATFFFLLFMLRAIGKKSWTISVVTSLGIGLCTFVIFEWFLESQLPVGPWGF